MIEVGKAGAQRVLARLKARNEADTQQVERTVQAVLASVRQEGDAALARYALQFEQTDYQKTPLRVAQSEIDAAYAACSTAQIEALRLAVRNIRRYHERQVEQGYTLRADGTTLMQVVRPLACVGIYAPGGTAAYPSSVLMNAVPAKVAGVGRVCLATPAQKGAVAPLTLVAAREAGVDEIYRMGGAQAVAAFAYGTQSVPRVDKITGPGNLYVTLAKKAVFGTVGIDAIAGPSEVLILADESADPAYVAADMLAQAEHDVAAAALCVTPSMALAQQVQAQLEAQQQRALRREIIQSSLTQYGAIVVLDGVQACLDFANDVAPEHLEILMQNAWDVLDGVQNAGGVFVGPYAPESLGDYLAGTNHVLPTAGTARFASPLGVYDFIKRMSVLSYDKGAFERVVRQVETLAMAEGLQAHARSATIRLERGDKG